VAHPVAVRGYRPIIVAPGIASQLAPHLRSCVINGFIDPQSTLEFATEGVEIPELPPLSQHWDFPAQSELPRGRYLSDPYMTQGSSLDVGGGHAAPGARIPSIPRPTPSFGQFDDEPNGLALGGSAKDHRKSDMPVDGTDKAGEGAVQDVNGRRKSTASNLSPNMAFCIAVALVFSINTSL
jgi:hypothetical protein